MNINLTAHNILGHLSKNKWHVHKLGDGPATYKLMTYEWVDFQDLCKLFGRREPKEIRFSIETLTKNGHVETRWEGKEARAVQDGDIAFENDFYINIYDKEKADRSENFQKRHWWLTHIVTFVIGVAIPLTIVQLNNPNKKKQPATANEVDSVIPTIDSGSTSDNTKNDQNKNDSTTTEKK